MGGGRRGKGQGDGEKRYGRRRDREGRGDSRGRTTPVVGNAPITPRAVLLSRISASLSPFPPFCPPPTSAPAPAPALAAPAAIGSCPHTLSPDSRSSATSPTESAGTAIQVEEGRAMGEEVEEVESRSSTSCTA
jgi:hypothetical protein